MPVTIKQVLAKTRALIENPGQWTKGSSARDACGTTRNSCSVLAICFCLDGALVRACWEVAQDTFPHRTDWDLYREAEAHVRMTLGDDPIRFNDDPETTHDEVLELLDKAHSTA